MKKATDVDEYIESFPENVQKKLERIRRVIKKNAPRAEEAISYMIPTFKLNGNLVHFAAFKDHISFFPTSSGIKKFKKELKDYKISKGTIQFPIEKVDYGLIARITRFRVKENTKE